MKISTRLKIAELICVAVVAVIVAVLLSTTLRVKHELAKNQQAGEILQAVTAIRYLTLEYALRHDERTRDQWLLRGASLSKLLKTSTEFTGTEEEAILKDLLETHDNVGTLFSQLVKNHQDLELDKQKNRDTRSAGVQTLRTDHEQDASHDLGGLEPLHS